MEGDVVDSQEPAKVQVQVHCQRSRDFKDEIVVARLQ